MKGPDAGRHFGRLRVAGLSVLLVLGMIPASLEPFTLLSYLSYSLVGAYLVARRPRNTVGWLLIAIVIGFVATTATPDWDIAALMRGEASVRDEVTAWLGAWSGSATFVGYLALTIIFPSGHLPSNGRRASVALLTIGVSMVVLVALAPMIGVTPEGSEDAIAVPNPFAVLPDLALWTVLPVRDGGVTVVVGLLVVGVIRLFGRYRRSAGVERLQLRWLVAAITAVLCALVFGLIVFGLELVPDGLGWIPVILAYPTIPIAVGIAVMRYRLYEIDRIVSRGIAYAIVTGLLGSVFAVGVVALSTVLSVLAQGASIAVAASTLAVFAIFQPVMRRVGRAVDRRFDRAHYDIERTATAFSHRLRDEVDMETVTIDLARTATAAVAPTFLAIWLRSSQTPSKTTTP
jgi:hypothetical protein